MPVEITGLTYIPKFVSPGEQSQLITIIDRQHWLNDLTRRVQHYGYRYDYRSRSVGVNSYLGPLPGWLADLAARIHREGLTDIEPDQAVVNEYLPGQGIAPHVDCVPCFGETIFSLSLISPCVMQFTPIKGSGEVNVLLEPRSLLVMQGEARYDWKHGIAARKTDTFDGMTIRRGRRISVTFRSVQPHE